MLFLDSVGSVAIHRSTPTTSYPPSATHHPPPTIRHLPLPPTVRPERSRFAAKSKGPQPRREASTSCLRHYAQHERLCRTTFFGRAQRLEYAARSGVNDHAFVLPPAEEGWGGRSLPKRRSKTPPPNLPLQAGGGAQRRPVQPQYPRHPKHRKRGDHVFCSLPCLQGRVGVGSRFADESLSAQPIPALLQPPRPHLATPARRHQPAA